MDVEKFMQAFRGSDLGYGTYISSEDNGEGKVGGKALTLRGKPTKQQWENHLNGKEPSLGIIPINEENNCYWGCIDIDEYPLNHKEISQKIKKLPLVMFRSKSGGAHLILFSKGPVKAEVMRKTLENIASDLGYSSAEIFPKQDFILLDRGDLGNFLNLPFHNAKSTTRYAFKDDGTSATLEEFFDIYDRKAMKPDNISKVKIQVEEELIPNGPPCLQRLCSQGFPQGHRNLGLFSLGVYARKAFPDEWERKVEEYNQKYMKPALDFKEIAALIKSLQKTDYNYKCKEDPIKPFCKSSLCRKRRFGIDAGSVSKFTNLTRLNTEPPLWFLNVNGQRVELETEQLHSQHLFQIACMNQLGQLPTKVDKGWQQLLQSLLEEKNVIDAPPEASVTGQFIDLLEDFCTSIGQAETREEILLRRPFTEKGKTYFKWGDLERHLKQNDFKNLGRPKLWSLLRSHGGDTTTIRIENQQHRVWVIKEFEKEPDIPERKVVERNDPF